MPLAHTQLMFHTRRQWLLLSCVTLPAFLTLGNSPGTASSAISSPTTVDLVAQRPTDRFQPLPANICDRLRVQMAERLKVKVTLTTASFEDQITQRKGTGCQLTATGTGRNFNSIPDIASSLNKMLAGQGWVADNRYAADEPEGKLSGFRKDDGLALLEVKSALTNSVNCPDNVAIATCYEQAQPEQILYHITLKAARQNE